MNSIDRQLANVVGGKTARACDSCLRKRARWFCAADDAFLCQGCDSLVHSANQLACRHERVRLGTASNKRYESKTLTENYVPSWHKGKARTPRQNMKDKDRSVHIYAPPLVPDLCTDDSFFEEIETQLLYRVPVSDPFDAELCNMSNGTTNEPIIQNDEANVMVTNNKSHDLEDFLPSDMEFAEFAAVVETLFGTRLDEESCGMEGLGLISCKEEKECFEESRVKIEDDDEVQDIIACSFDRGLNLSKGCLDWNLDDDESPVIGEEEKVEVVEAEAAMVDGENREMRRKKILRLSYEQVIVAWDNQGCPWTSGIRPQLNPDDCCLDFMAVMTAPDTYHRCGSSGTGRGDGGRGARVSRYREKRRRRLFSKKIRYQVRKLNAEKRPRMKGRFVKRSSFAGVSTTTIPSHMMNK